MKLPYRTAMLLAVTAFPAAAATIGTLHISEIGNTFFVDQEFAASVPPHRDYTGFRFTSTGSFSYDYTGSFLDDGVSIFLVEPNEVFSEAAILGGQFVELKFGNIYTFPLKFHLGIRTPALGVNVNSYEPAYGWAEIRNSANGDLVLVDHAIAYGAQGIIVGTLTAVPEPSGTVLLGIGMLSLLGFRRRDKCIGPDASARPLSPAVGLLSHACENSGEKR